jgi:hypothetical protein
MNGPDVGLVAILAFWAGMVCGVIVSAWLQRNTAGACQPTPQPGRVAPPPRDLFGVWVGVDPGKLGDDRNAVCHFPTCKCPMDPGRSPDWCARGLPHARGAQAVDERFAAAHYQDGRDLVLVQSDSHAPPVGVAPPAAFLSMRIVEDPSVPADQVVFRDPASGRELGRIVGVGEVTRG